MNHTKKLQIEFLVGVSCSGKSTYAKEKCVNDATWKRVNKDDIRENYLSGIKESKVISIEEEQIQNYLENGFNVVVDNTHLNPIHLDRIKKRFFKWADVVVNDSFLEVSLDVILERARQRPNTKDRSGKEVTWESIVMKQKNEWVVPKKLYEDPNYWTDTSLPKVVLVDADGTACIHNGRSPFQFEKCGEDLPNYPLLDTLTMYSSREDVSIIVLSGRPDTYRDLTANWFTSYGIKFDALLMRQAGDNRNDAIVKREIYENEIKGKYLIYAVYDDRKRVVENLWVQEGLPIFAFGNPYHDF